MYASSIVFFGKKKSKITFYYFIHNNKIKIKNCCENYKYLQTNNVFFVIISHIFSS